jgi:hypothetical protein
MNKIVLIWHFTLVLIKINYGQIKQGSFIQQTQYFIPVEIDLSVVPARLGIRFFHLSRRLRKWAPAMS